MTATKSTASLPPATDDRWRSSSRALVLTLRVGACLCFVGHGAFGIMTKASWLPYFAVAGIGPSAAYTLMPIIGVIDIALGLSMLLVPVPIVAGWMMVWALWTACLRPLAGEPAWEMLERAGNYGVPAAILLLMAPRRVWWDALRRARPRPIVASVLAAERRVLTIALVMLLVGHGALGVAGTHGIIANYSSVTGPTIAITIAPWIGRLEIALALVVALRPDPRLLLGVAAWKIVSESLFLFAGAPIWEFVERGGSYAIPLALSIVMRMISRLREGGELFVP